jgi:hypothetical protein
VKHDYHDHALDTDEYDDDEEDVVLSDNGKRRPCTTQTFPMKLLAVLEQIELDGLSDVIGWQPHGRCFCIHKNKEFVEYVMPTYFRQGKLTSFQRQLNLYGFARLTRGKDAGAYYHELFLRGKANLAKRMKRTKIKGTKFKAASSPESEPDFYSMVRLCSLYSLILPTKRKFWFRLLIFDSSPVWHCSFSCALPSASCDRSTPSQRRIII